MRRRRRRSPRVPALILLGVIVVALILIFATGEGSPKKEKQEVRLIPIGSYLSNDMSTFEGMDKMDRSGL